MKKIRSEFNYVRYSNSGNPYEVTVSLTVEAGGYAVIEAPFSLEETLDETKNVMTPFLVDAMKKLRLGVAECHNRVNHGAPTHPINRGGRYYSVDGKLYRYDKHIFGSWRAPASDLLRILLFLQGKRPDFYDTQFIPGL